MKRFMKYFWLWLIPIVLDIANIIIISINGASLFNNIMAWVLVTYFTLLLGVDKTIQVCKSEERLERAKTELDKTLEEIWNAIDEEDTPENKIPKDNKTQQDNGTPKQE